MRRLNLARFPYCSRMAASLVSVSVSEPVSAEMLHTALYDPTAPRQSAARQLMEEASEQLLAGLVLEGFIDWHTLAEAAERYPPAKDETAAWLRDMARLALA
jgi:hypothetical protein